jgi:hypothetical protein
MPINIDTIDNIIKYIPKFVLRISLHKYVCRHSTPLNKRNAPKTIAIIARIELPFGATSSKGVKIYHRFLDTFSSSQYIPVKQGKH